MEIWQLAISIAGVIIGFLVGFFAEPVKVYFLNIREKKLLREGMYKEIAFFYERMVNISSGDDELGYDWDTYKKTLQVIARFECYEYAKANPMLFYQIDESSVLNKIYATYKTYVEGYIFDNVEEHARNAKGIITIVESIIKNQELNKSLFINSIDREGRLIVQQRLKE